MQEGAALGWPQGLVGSVEIPVGDSYVLETLGN